MIPFLKAKAENLFGKGHQRTQGIKKNIIFSFFVRGGGALTGFVLLPVTIHYINAVQYGVWLTISSVVLWMNNFDIGLSNGLRNKLAGALAHGDYDNMRKYISTTYAALCIIAVLTYIAFAIFGPYVNWNRVLNVPVSVINNVKQILLIVLSCFCVQFVLQPINTILTATHQVYKVSVVSFTGQLLSLCVVYMLTLYTKGSLVNAVLVLAGIPVLVLFLANIFFFSTSLKNLTPCFKYIDIKSAASLLGVGGAFFFLQMAALIIYQTDNVIITNVIGPEAVTTFNVAYKLFNILFFIAVVIMTPYWSAFTDAYAKKEFGWIKNSLRRMRQAWLVLTLASAAFFFCSGFIYRFWVGPGIVIKSSLTLAMAVYVSAYMFQGIYTYFLNGVGKIRLQLIVLFVSAAVNIPLCLYWGRFYGLAGIVNANTLVTVVMNILFYVQSLKIINGTASGIWNK